MQQFVTWLLSLLGLLSAVSPTPIITPTPTPSPTPLPIILSIISGKVSVNNSPATSSQELKINDEVNSAEKSLATVNYGEGLVVRVGPSTKFIIHKSNIISHTLGSIYIRFKKILGIREEFSVETPTALATVRGSAFASILPDLFYVTDDQIEIKKGTESAVLTASDSSKIKLDPKQQTWIDFNVTVDQQPEDIASLAAQTLFKPTPLPTTKPTVAPTPIPLLNSMPGGGYTRGTVKTERGNFVVSCIGGNRNSIKVITDSGNESDCRTDCTVLPLHEYATRNGGFAAMNGTYFCPADYPACAEKKNSFDTLFFNSRSRRYLNSDNNVYSVLPFLVVNSDGTTRFNTRTLEWGRDTGIQAGIAGNPMLVQGSNMVANENNLDTKQRTVKSNRGAIANKGDMTYMCVVSGATVYDTAFVYKALGADNAMNIDGGGSSAMWLSGRYIFGPGRSLPNAVVFARK